MIALEILFWSAALVVVYTYVGYGILLYACVRIKERIKPAVTPSVPQELPRVTLLIAAYNEEQVVVEKMQNTWALNYPNTLLEVIWVTDGSTDHTNEQLQKYTQVRLLFEPKRQGKAAAIDRAMSYVTTPLVIYTDANTILCRDAVMEIVTQFNDPNVGCVAGEKRIALLKQQDATAAEGIYWRYESTLKALDYRLYSAVGAAGELFAIRTPLYQSLPHDTLLDDFMLSMKIAQQGYKIAYCAKAYAVESASADIIQEAKRKVRIAAGGLQSIIRLRALLNVWRYGTLSFQYISHRVLRWSLTPILWFALLPLNIVLLCHHGLSSIYTGLLLLQLLFYSLALGGYLMHKRAVKNKFLFIPYYFLFMNVCVFQGVHYLTTHQGSGVWEKATRKTSM